MLLYDSITLQNKLSLCRYVVYVASVTGPYNRAQPMKIPEFQF